MSERLAADRQIGAGPPDRTVSIIALLVDDHALKGAYPGWWTGKLSVIAGLLWIGWRRTISPRRRSPATRPVLTSVALALLVAAAPASADTRPETVQKVKRPKIDLAAHAAVGWDWLEEDPNKFYYVGAAVGYPIYFKRRALIIQFRYSWAESFSGEPQVTNRHQLLVGVRYDIPIKRIILALRLGVGAAYALEPGDGKLWLPAIVSGVSARYPIDRRTSIGVEVVAALAAPSEGSIGLVLGFR